MPLPTDYTDSTTPTGATTELPATTGRGLNAITGQINTNTAAVAAFGTAPTGAVVGTTDTQTLSGKTINGQSNTLIAGQLMPVRCIADGDGGTYTYTITGGNVTQINGTTLDGISVAVGDRVLIQSAPASTGVGSWMSTQPGNGIYVVTGNTTNISVTRAADMSGSVNPAGLSVFIAAGSFTGWQFAVFTPNNPATAFTYGTTSMRWGTNGAPGVATTDTFQTFNNKTISGASNTLSNIPATAVTGLTSGNTSQQSQLVVSATAYYITGSALTVPTNLAVGSRFRWTVAMKKDAAGTGTFQVRVYRGTNGSTADTADVTQSFGTQTAVIDNMTVDVEIVVTATGATGSYYWTIIPMHTAARITGFGLDQAAASFFSGTVSSVALNTASLKFGLSFIATTGTPTITVPLVRAQAYV